MSEEEDVSFIIRSMPELEYLNGIRVNRAELGDMSDANQSQQVDEVMELARQVRPDHDTTLQELSMTSQSFASRKTRAARRKSVGSGLGVAAAHKRKKSYSSVVHEDVRASLEMALPETRIEVLNHSFVSGGDHESSVASTVAARVEHEV